MYTSSMPLQVKRSCNSEHTVRVGILAIGPVRHQVKRIDIKQSED